MKKEEISKFKKGTKWRTKQNYNYSKFGQPRSNGRGTRNGEKRKIITVKGITHDNIGNNLIISKNSQYYPWELESISETVEKIESQIAKKVKEIKELENKIKFMKENGLDEYSQSKYRAYKIIQESEKDMEINKKIDMISKMLK